MRRSSSSRVRGETGSVAVIGILMMTLLSLVGTSLLAMSLTENTIASNDLWSEGAFHAAEAGIHAGIDQLSANRTASSQSVPVTTIGARYAYRSGRRSDADPQPLQFAGARTEAGYSIGLGTGYNPSGYAFHAYQINATGTGPRVAQREIEALAEYGPVPR